MAEEDELTKLYKQLKQEINSDNPSTILRACHKIKKIYPDDDNVTKCQIIAFIKTQKYDVALSLIPDDKKFLFEKSYILYRMENYQESVSILETMEDSIDVLHLKAQNYYRLEMYEKAISNYKKVFVFCNNNNIQLSYELICNYASSLINNQQYNEALNELLRYQDKTYEILYLTLLSYFLLHQNDMCKSLIDKCITTGRRELEQLGLSYDEIEVELFNIYIIRFIINGISTPSIKLRDSTGFVLNSFISSYNKVIDKNVQKNKLFKTSSNILSKMVPYQKSFIIYNQSLYILKANYGRDRPKVNYKELYDKFKDFTYIDNNILSLLLAYCSSFYDASISDLYMPVILSNSKNTNIIQSLENLESYLLDPKKRQTILVKIEDKSKPKDKKKKQNKRTQKYIEKLKEKKKYKDPKLLDPERWLPKVERKSYIEKQKILNQKYKGKKNQKFNKYGKKKNFNKKNQNLHQGTTLIENEVQDKPSVASFPGKKGSQQMKTKNAFVNRKKKVHKKR